MDTEVFELVKSLARPLFDAVMSGQYVLGAAMALVLVVSLVRRYGAGRWPFLATDAGGAALALVSGVAGALMTALAAGAAFTWGMLARAFLVTVTAAGGYSFVRKLLVPLMMLLPQPLSAWAVTLLSLFDKPSPVAKAEAAGKKAVADKPPTGADGVLGKAEEIE